MQLLAERLDFRVEELTRLHVTVFQKRGFNLLTAARDALSEHALVICDILTESPKLEGSDALLSYLLVGFLQDALVHRLFGLVHRPLHLPVVHLDAFFDGAIALVLAHVAPSVLDVGHRPFVDR